MFEVLYVALCGVFLVLTPATPSLAAACVKILPIAMLVARAARRGPTGSRRWLVLGLLSSLAGDFILAASPERFFVLGLAAFLVAHIFYVLTFRRDMRYSTRAAVLSACVFAWCVGLGAIVFPHLGTLRVPVLTYMVVIAAMGASAAFASGRRLTLFAGAAAFIVSDSMIAVDRFVAPFGLAPYLVMVTYYVGQYFIVKGVLQHE